MNKEQKLPDWYNDTVQKEGSTVTNRLTGEEYTLTAVELTIYDFVLGAQVALKMGMDNPQILLDIRRGKDWFRENNMKAYMVLLD